MTCFKVMDGEFGIDGLKSKHAVTTPFDTVDEAFRFIMEQIENGPVHMRRDATGYWVEEHTDPDDDYSGVRVQEPYPHTKIFDHPDWFSAKMRTVKVPTHEETMAAIRELGRDALKALEGR